MIFSQTKIALRLWLEILSPLICTWSWVHLPVRCSVDQSCPVPLAMCLLDLSFATCFSNGSNYCWRCPGEPNHDGHHPQHHPAGWPHWPLQGHRSQLPKGGAGRQHQLCCLREVSAGSGRKYDVNSPLIRLWLLFKIA